MKIHMFAHFSELMPWLSFVLLFSWGSYTPLQTATAGLELTVVAAEHPARVLPRAVWLGIRNRTRSPKLFCILSRAMWQKVSNAPSHMTGDGFSPHGCQSDEAYTIVLPNETAYVAWPLSRSFKARVDQVLVVEVEIAIRGLSAGPRTTTLLEWTGTASEMVAAGKALVKE